MKTTILLMLCAALCAALSACATVPVPELNIKCTVGITKNDD